MLIKLLAALLLVGTQQAYGLPSDIGNSKIHRDNKDHKSGTETAPMSNEFVEDVKSGIAHWPMSVKSKYVSVMPEQEPESAMDSKEPEKNQLIQTRSAKILPPASPDLDSADYSIPYNRGKTISSDPKDPGFRFPELPPPMNSKIQEFRESNDEQEDNEAGMLGPRALEAENLPLQTLKSENSFLNNIPAVEETTNDMQNPKEINKREEEENLTTNAQTGLSNTIQTGTDADKQSSKDVPTAATEIEKSPENKENSLTAVEKLPENSQTGFNVAIKPENMIESEINGNKGPTPPEITQVNNEGGAPTNNVQMEPATGVIKPEVHDSTTQTDLTTPQVNGGISGQRSKPDSHDSTTQTDLATPQVNGGISGQIIKPEAHDSTTQTDLTTPQVNGGISGQIIKPEAHDSTTQTDLTTPEVNGGISGQIIKPHPNSEDAVEDENLNEDSLLPAPALLTKIMRLAGLSSPVRCALVVVNRRQINPFQIPSPLQPQPESFLGSRNFFEPFRSVQSPSFTPSRFFARPEFPIRPFFGSVPSHYDSRQNPLNPFSPLFRK